MDLRKKPHFRVLDPRTNKVHHVLIVRWDKKQKIAHVVDESAQNRIIPWSYFSWVECG